MIGMLRALRKKMYNMQDQMGNISREMQTLRNNKKEILATKKIITEMNTFEGLINRLDGHSSCNLW